MKMEIASRQKLIDRWAKSGCALALSMSLFFGLPTIAEANQILTQDGNLFHCVAVKRNKCVECDGSTITIRRGGKVTNTEKKCPRNSDSSDPLQSLPANPVHRPDRTTSE